jgi:Mce-associated membrane protein
LAVVTSDLDTQALILAAEEAEAEAEAAEAAATAARARARAARLRYRADAASAGAAEDSATKAADSGGTKHDRGPDAAPEPAGRAGAHEDVVDSRPAAGAAGPSNPESPDSESPGAESPGTESPGTESPDTGNVRTAEHAADTAPSPRRRRVRAMLRRRGRTALVAAATAVIVASIGGGGFAAWQHHQVTEKNRRTAEYTAAARQGIVALTSLDFNRARDDVQRILDNSTGSFHDDFQGRADDFTKVIQQSQVSTEGKVDAAAVESMTNDSAVVLVAATSQVTNAAGAKQEPRVWRLSVTVSRVGEQLKMSKVEFVP